MTVASKSLYRGDFLRVSHYVKTFPSTRGTIKMRRVGILESATQGHTSQGTWGPLTFEAPRVHSGMLMGPAESPWSAICGVGSERGAFQPPAWGQACPLSCGMVPPARSVRMRGGSISCWSPSLPQASLTRAPGGGMGSLGFSSSPGCRMHTHI